MAMAMGRPRVQKYAQFDGFSFSKTWTDRVQSFDCKKTFICGPAVNLKTRLSWSHKLYTAAILRVLELVR